MVEFRNWTKISSDFDRFGFAVLKNLPTGERDLEEVAASIGGYVDGIFERAVSEISFDPLKPPKSGSIAYSDAPLSPHTDGSFEPQPPTDLLMQCISSDEPGFGTTIIVDIRAVLRDLSPEHISLLSDDSYIFTRNETGVASTVQEPILYIKDELPGIRYREDSKYKIEARAPQAVYALNVLREAIRSDRYQSYVYLHEGDVVWINNSRVLHGRTKLSGRRLRVIRRLRLARMLMIEKSDLRQKDGR